MKEIEFSRWLFELPAKYHSQFSPSGSTFLPCLSLPQKADVRIQFTAYSKGYIYFFFQMFLNVPWATGFIPLYKFILVMKIETDEV